MPPGRVAGAVCVSLFERGPLARSPKKGGGEGGTAVGAVTILLYNISSYDFRTHEKENADTGKKHHGCLLKVPQARGGDSDPIHDRHERGRPLRSCGHGMYELVPTTRGVNHGQPVWGVENRENAGETADRSIDLRISAAWSLLGRQMRAMFDPERAFTVR